MMMIPDNGNGKDTYLKSGNVDDDEEVDKQKIVPLIVLPEKAATAVFR